LPQSQRNTQVHLQKVFQDVLLIQNHLENQILKVVLQAKKLLLKMEPRGLYLY
jgi:sensor domain CHASE-containing protein